ncbi:MAG: hypothetical protein D8M59_09030 [Planctomycetes bacterium]|nr:hypothetical protein [Planctomycetota bacterium]NOG54203.1 hypothetical protein [Planctomycetota bacterium]
MVDLSETKRTRLAWTAYPARERLGASCGALAIVLAVAGGVAFTTNWSLSWAGLAVAVQILALYRYFFPSRFEIDEKGISARYLIGRQRHLWSHIRRFHHDGQGVYLSTRAHRSRWDAFRGMHVLYGTRQDDVLALIRDYMAASRNEASAQGNGTDKGEL